MVRAVVDGVVVAEADKTEKVEGNHYFPPSGVKSEYFTESGTHTVCGWKGTASYKNIVVNGKEIKDAAWYYPVPKDSAKNITGYYAFYTGKGVKIES